MTFSLEYESNEELIRKISAIAETLGYRVVNCHPHRLTVGQLAAQLKRPVATVSRSLKRLSCPPFDCRRGKRRILWLEVNVPLLKFLSSPGAGGRPKQNRS